MDGDWQEQYQPLGPVEILLVQQIVMATWRLCRVRGMETAAFELRLGEHAGTLDHECRGLSVLCPVVNPQITQSPIIWRPPGPVPARTSASLLCRAPMSPTCDTADRNGRMIFGEFNAEH